MQTLVHHSRLTPVKGGVGGVTPSTEENPESTPPFRFVCYSAERIHSPLEGPAFPSGSQTPKGLLKKSEDGDFAVIPANAGIQADGNGRKAGMRRFGAGGGIPLTLGSLISSGFRHSPE